MLATISWRWSRLWPGKAWFEENLCLKIVGFEGKEKEGYCAGVLDDEFAGRHIQQWQLIPPRSMPATSARRRRRTPIAAESMDYCRRC